MGQALRRTAGKVRAPEPPPPVQQFKNAELRPQMPPQESAYVPTTAAQDRLGIPDAEDFSSKKDTSSILQERDPTYDAMLGQMVGRITSKSGGKLEMGETAVVEKYNRPLPKLRTSTTTTASGYHEEKPAPAGTLNIAQLRQIIQLHEDKSEEHRGPMGVEAIANRFRIDAAEVRRILQFVSLPPEDTTNKQTENL